MSACAIAFSRLSPRQLHAEATPTYTIRIMNSLAAIFMCHNPIMPTRSSKDHDFSAFSLRVVEQAIGEKMDGSALDDPCKGKNPAAVALGKLGGAKGGAARAAALSPRKRSQIAKNAAMARWSKT